MSDLKERHWHEQCAIAEKIGKAGSFQKYAETLPDILNAVISKQEVCCIDEGTPDGIRFAGSGIYYVITQGTEKGKKGKEAIYAGLEAAAEAVKGSPAEFITSHDECGAAGLVFNEMPDSIKKEFGTSDNLGIYFAKELSKKTGLGYRHIGIKEMARPSGMHTAMFAYYDGTGKFNPDAVPGLPQGFVVSRKYLGKEEALREIELAPKIATGEHGYGGLIKPDKKFWLIAVAEDPWALESLVSELKPVSDSYKGKVKVEGFLVKA
ncbi:hypothetical protein JXB11_03095 [Candidatus Woesearchaeota archaeon]|nr:hypothetical protein [Candidatus Woesearchaeota archaeon]